MAAEDALAGLNTAFKQPTAPGDDALSGLEDAFGPSAGVISDVALPGTQPDVSPEFRVKLGEAISKKDQFLGDFRNIVLRMQTSFAKDPGEAANFLQKKFGKDNVRISDGNLFVRRKTGDTFKALDPETFEIFADTIGDFAGELVEGAATLGVEAGAAAAGGPAGAVIGLPIAGAAGVKVRQAVGKFVGFERDLSKFDVETATAAGLNVAFAGLGTLGRAGLKRIIPEAPKQVAIKALSLQSEMVRTLRSFGFRKKGAQELGEGLVGKARDLPSQRGGILARIKEGLNDRLGAIIDQAEDLSGGERRAFPEVLAGLKETLEKDFKILFDEKHTLIGPEGQQILNPNFLKMRADKEALTKFPLGVSDPKDSILEIKKAWDLLVEAQKKGGMTISELHNATRSFQNLSEFDSNKPLKDSVLAVFSEVQNKLGEARFKWFDELASDSKTPFGQEARATFAEFAEKAGPLRDFLGAFNRTKNPIKFAKELIKPDEAVRIKELKALLTENSEAWASIKGQWISDIWKKSTKNGILDGKKFTANLEKFGSEVLDEMFLPGEFAATKEVAKRMGNLNLAALDATPSNMKLLKGFSKWALFHDTFMGRHAQIGIADELMLRVAKVNPDMMEQLINRGFSELSAEAANVSEKVVFNNARDRMKFYARHMVRKGNQLIFTKGLRQFFNQTAKGTIPDSVLGREFKSLFAEDEGLQE